ncbi:hypothetical protein A2U01_0073343, partial [Trifolium medium]|nr:hypothetical protein [Trifolium medium]
QLRNTDTKNGSLHLAVQEVLSKASCEEACEAEAVKGGVKGVEVVSDISESSGGTVLEVGNDFPLNRPKKILKNNALQNTVRSMVHQSGVPLFRRMENA